MINSQTGKATGNITPRRIVKIDTSADNSVAQASAASDNFCGISAADTHVPPYPGLDDGYHATAGESCEYFGNGSTDVPVDLGGTVTAGDQLTADSSGRAITSTTDHDKVIGKAKCSGVLGEIGLCDVQFAERSV